MSLVDGLLALVALWGIVFFEIYCKSFSSDAIALAEGEPKAENKILPSSSSK